MFVLALVALLCGLLLRFEFGLLYVGLVDCVMLALTVSIGLYW